MVGKTRSDDNLETVLVDVARIGHVVSALVDLLAEDDDLLEQEHSTIAEDLLLSLGRLASCLVVHHLQSVLQQQLALSRNFSLRVQIK